MRLLIETIADSVRLGVKGDIETKLTVHYDDHDRFFMGFSDGTLVLDTYKDTLLANDKSLAMVQAWSGLTMDRQ
ncbi:hypothetical protein Sbs19_39800 [Sphingobium sp. BS19]|nr:hypothetical protein Sbs19_39800 [Sphingobium sp. BS19]